MIRFRLYRHLNELAKRCKPILVTREILQMVMQFLVYDLNFERCLVLAVVTLDDPAADDHTTSSEPGGKSYQALIWEGYDDDDLDFAFVKEDFQLVMQSMEMGTTRIQEIVLSLRNFSRMDEAEVKTVDLHEGLESTLLILQHRLKRTHDRPEVQLVKDYGAIQVIECAAGLVNWASRLATKSSRRNIKASWNVLLPWGKVRNFGFGCSHRCP